MNRLDRATLEQDLAREEARLRELEAQAQRARSRVESLRLQVDECREPSPKLLSVVGPRTSSDKIALFRALFRGRADVYPTRWRNSRMDAHPRLTREGIRAALAYAADTLANEVTLSLESRG